MIIRVQKDKENPFIVIHKEIDQNPFVSARAKGVFLHLMGKPDNWRIYLDELQKNFSEGREAIRKAVKELEFYGYVVRDQTRKEGGKFDKASYTVHEKTVLGQPRLESFKSERPEKKRKEGKFTAAQFLGDGEKASTAAQKLGDGETTQLHKKQTKSPWPKNPQLISNNNILVNNEREREEKPFPKSPETASDPLPKPAVRSLSDFEKTLKDFWEIYPKRNGIHPKKSEAEKLLRKFKPESKQLLKAVRQYAKCNDVQEGVIMHAVNWLKDWESWVPETNGAPTAAQRYQNQQDTREQIEAKKAALAEEKFQKLPEDLQQKIYHRALERLRNNGLFGNRILKLEKEDKDPLENPVYRELFIEYRNKIMCSESITE